MLESGIKHAYTNVDVVLRPYYAAGILPVLEKKRTCHGFGLLYDFASCDCHYDAPSDDLDCLCI